MVPSRPPAPHAACLASSSLNHQSLSTLLAQKEAQAPFGENPLMAGDATVTKSVNQDRQELLRDADPALRSPDIEALFPVFQKCPISASTRRGGMRAM